MTMDTYTTFSAIGLCIIGALLVIWHNIWRTRSSLQLADIKKSREIMGKIGNRIVCTSEPGTVEVAKRMMIREAGEFASEIGRGHEDVEICEREVRPGVVMISWEVAV